MLGLVSAALILAGVGVMFLVFRARGISSGNEIGKTYNEGKADLIWTMAPFSLILVLVVAVALDNRC